MKTVPCPTCGREVRVLKCGETAAHERLANAAGASGMKHEFKWERCPGSYQFIHSAGLKP